MLNYYGLAYEVSNKLFVKPSANYVYHNVLLGPVEEKTVLSLI